ncbi:hypothetical protein FEM48_Zijuj10G0154700 [Ziziphus jujuba var. spinosa]|uniref:RING-type domain-containing protein n=1 Tax=Ziziphus jujuba var. spinosa TaxID=714518 RepID=A0A978UP72_ZIZJJ|nr:hypothetical protein FEM48_Zijuj10G0154700 [Ziziphus jujuba var. spinosa]
MWNFMVSIFTHLKWAFNFLLCYSFSVLVPYPCQNVTITCSKELSTTKYRRESEDENLECAVCLSSIDEGEEIGELRCSHLFHKSCLNKWVFFNRTTCPLCRGSLAPPLAQPELGVEVIFIKLWPFRSGGEDRDTWWLR